MKKNARKGGQRKALPGWMPESPPAARGSRKPPAKPARGGKRTPAHAPAHDPQAEREARRYEKPIASREMILGVLAAHDGPMDTQALAERLPRRVGAEGGRERLQV